MVYRSFGKCPVMRPRPIGLVGKATQLDPDDTNGRLLLRVKRRRSSDVRCTSASPLSPDDLERRPECLQRARSGRARRSILTREVRLYDRMASWLLQSP